MPKVREEQEGGIIEKPVDSAGRVAIPGEFLREFPGHLGYLMFWTAPCLRLVSLEAYGRIEADLLSSYDDAQRLEWLRRRTLGTRRSVTIDENGRVRIPSVYLEYLELPAGGARVVLARYDEGVVEIWKPETYRALVLKVDYTGPFWQEALLAQLMGDDRQAVAEVLDLLRAKAQLEAMRPSDAPPGDTAT